MALVPEKIEIVLTEESINAMKAFSDSVEKFCHAAKELSSALQKSNNRPTKRAADVAYCACDVQSSKNFVDCDYCGKPIKRQRR